MFGVLLLSLTLPLVYTAPTTYTDYNGRRVYYPLAVAALANSPTGCLNANFAGQFQEIKNYTVDCDILNWNNSDTCYAYKAYWATNNTIVFGFRGSQGDQVSQEANATENKHQLYMPGVGYVNYYFYNAFLRLQANMSDDIQAAVTDSRNPKFLFVGHSLGGALASVFAAYMKKNQSITPDRLQLVTFGMPRTGNVPFASYIETFVGTRYRVVANDDLVPHSIPNIVPVTDTYFYNDYYQNWGQEIWYNNTMAVGDPIRACTLTNEDSSCSNSLQLSALNAVEHVYYYNILQDFYETNQCIYPTPAKCPDYYEATGTTQPIYCIRAYAGLQKTTWVDAESFCEQSTDKPTTLAAIDTVFRNNYILNISRSQTKSTCQRYFIGLHQNDKTWEWSDKTTPYIYQNWGPLVDPNFPEYNVAYMDDTNNNGKWYFGDGKTDECFVCGYNTAA